jgi:hypothetical protein
MRDANVDNLRAQIAPIASSANMKIVDVVVDAGPPKRHPSEYPILSRLARGEADVLLLGRSPRLRRSPDRDLLESKCQPQPMAFFTVAELRALGLFPTGAAEQKPRTAAGKEPHPPGLHS